MPNSVEPLIQLILVVIAPPPGVQFAVQRGRAELHGPYTSDAESIAFAITLLLGPALPEGSFNFRGPFAQGTPADRFVYLNSGTRAGQIGTRWERRAKLKLAGIPRALVEAALGDADCALEARVLGRARDGGPVCATVSPQAVTWQLARRAPQH